MSQLNLSISIENNEIKINDIPIASISYVNNEIQKINIVNSVQQSVFQRYNGVTLTGMFPNVLNGTYIQSVDQRDLIATTDTVRFFKGSNYTYLRTDGTYYYLLVYVKPMTTKIFESISLQSPAWLIVRYQQDPSEISLNTNHYGLLTDSPLQAYVSSESHRFGSQTYPKTQSAEFF